MTRNRTLYYLRKINEALKNATINQNRLERLQDYAIEQLSTFGNIRRRVDEMFDNAQKESAQQLTKK